uniref:Uncharacterized protein n=1 Tax=Chrysolophus pictus TaxID=9089 RepID=A0A8C3LA87_CHRPC
GPRALCGAVLSLQGSCAVPCIAIRWRCVPLGSPAVPRTATSWRCPYRVQALYGVCPSYGVHVLYGVLCVPIGSCAVPRIATSWRCVPLGSPAVPRTATSWRCPYGVQALYGAPCRPYRVELPYGVLCPSRGRVLYQLAVSLCRAAVWGYFAGVRLEVLALTRHPELGCIRARWRLVGVPFHLCLLRFYRRDKRDLLRSAGIVSPLSPPCHLCVPIGTTEPGCRRPCCPRLSPLSPLSPLCPHLSPLSPLCPHCQRDPIVTTSPLSPLSPLCPHLSPLSPVCPHLSPLSPFVTSVSPLST